MINRIVIGAILAFLCLGCTKDKAPSQSMNDGICDSLSISYLNCVLPVFRSYCYRCHSDSASQNGSIAFDIENFNSLKTYLTYYYHGDSIYGSKFMRAINYQSGVLVMPPSNKIPDTLIARIRYWVESGAPYN